MKDLVDEERLMGRWRLEGQRAVVTGGSRGIGLAIVKELVGLGAEVVAVARRRVGLAEALAGFGGKVTPAVADVCTPEGRAALLEQLPAHWDHIEILVNNAGANLRKRTLAYSAEEYERLLATNLTSAFELCRLLHSRLRASGRASIVNIGSVAGITPIGTGIVYAMSKAALGHMTRALAAEWASDGIRVNLVAPWYTRTPLVEPVLDDAEVYQSVLARTPAGRIAEPEEVSAVVAFLCMPAASYVTGQIVAVDGGFGASTFSIPLPERA